MRSLTSVEEKIDAWQYCEMQKILQWLGHLWTLSVNREDQRINKQDNWVVESWHDQSTNTNRLSNWSVEATYFGRTPLSALRKAQRDQKKIRALRQKNG